MLKKFTWAHGIIIALGTFMIFILSLIFIFTRGWQNAEMVSNDYYADELQYQKVIDAKNLAAALPAKPVYTQSQHGLRISFPAEFSNANTKFRFELFRTDDERLDVRKEVTLGNDNSFTIPGKILAPGNYTLMVHWSKDQKDYQIDYDVVWTQH